GIDGDLTDRIASAKSRCGIVHARAPRELANGAAEALAKRLREMDRMHPGVRRQRFDRGRAAELVAQTLSGALEPAQMWYETLSPEFARRLEEYFEKLRLKIEVV